MAYVVAAVVVLGSLCVLDLVLSLGVVRRLREHTELLQRLSQGPFPPGGVGVGGVGSAPPAIPVGETVGEFAASTIEGEPVSRDLLVTPTLVGFFSPGCQPCAVELPRFVERAAAMSGTGGQALAVIDADVDAAARPDADGGAIDYVERLRPVAHVVVQRHREGTLQAAFRVAGYPTVYLVGAGGTVLDE